MRFGWRRFVLMSLGGFAIILAALAIFILLMNPYSNLPRLLFSEHVITDINQRFQYPALVRSKRYDSSAHPMRDCFTQMISSRYSAVNSSISP